MGKGFWVVIAAIGIVLTAGRSGSAADPPVQYSLTGAGFTHADWGKQTPGCGCGPSYVAIYAGGAGPNTNVPGNVINGQAGHPISFRWDGAYICRGQGIAGHPGSADLGSIDFGQGTKANLPEIYGIAKATYPTAGSYSVVIRATATCVDVHCSHRCDANGDVTINVQ
jgi:hypothetical protein